MEVSWIRERVWSTSSPVQFAGRLFFSEPQKPQEQIRVSIRNNGPSQKAAKMWHTHTLSHILHVVCAVIYFFFHSHTFTMCNSQHDKKKRKSKSQNKIMGTFMFTAAASGADGTDKAQAKGERCSIMREACHRNLITKQTNTTSTCITSQKKKRKLHPFSPSFSLSCFLLSFPLHPDFPAPLQVD